MNDLLEDHGCDLRGNSRLIRLWIIMNPVLTGNSARTRYGTRISGQAPRVQLGLPEERAMSGWWWVAAEICG